MCDLNVSDFYPSIPLCLCYIWINVFDISRVFCSQTCANVGRAKTTCQKEHPFLSITASNVLLSNASTDQSQWTQQPTLSQTLQPQPLRKLNFAVLLSYKSVLHSGHRVFLASAPRLISRPPVNTCTWQRWISVLSLLLSLSSNRAGFLH